LIGGNGRRLWIVLALGVAVLAALALWQRPRTNTPAPPTPTDAASISGQPAPVASDAPMGGALAELGVFGDVPDFNLVSQTGDSVRLCLATTSRHEGVDDDRLRRSEPVDPAHALL